MNFKGPFQPCVCVWFYGSAVQAIPCIFRHYLCSPTSFANFSSSIGKIIWLLLFHFQFCQTHLILKHILVYFRIWKIYSFIKILLFLSLLHFNWSTRKKWINPHFSLSSHQGWSPILANVPSFIWKLLSSEKNPAILDGFIKHKKWIKRKENTKHYS